MLGSGKAKRGDTKLLDNLIASQKQLASALAHARTTSESCGLATSAWATPDGPTAMHKTAILTRALAAADIALDDYAGSVTNFTAGLQDLLPQEAAVAEVSRDRDILIGRLVRLTKKKPKAGQEDKHLSVLANTQQELAACETVLASEQNALSQTRHHTLSEHARARLVALHLFGAQAQQVAAEALQQLDSLSAYVPTASPPQTPQTARVAVQQPDARSISQSYLAQQRGGAYPSATQSQYAVPAPVSYAPASVYEAAPSYQSADRLSYPRDAAVPTVAPVQEGNETFDGSSVYDPSSHPAADGIDGTEAGVGIASVGETGETGEDAVPSRRYSSEQIGVPSPYRSAEVGYVPDAPLAAGGEGEERRASRQEPVAVVTGVARGPQSGQQVLVVDEVFLTPTEEVGLNELQADAGYSSSDPDDNAQEHLGPYAAGAPQRSASSPYSARTGGTAEPRLVKKRTTRRVSHRKHNSEPNDQYAVGPDGAIDAVGQPAQFFPRRDLDEDSSTSESPKLSRHLSLMGNKKAKSSKHHGSNGHGHGHNFFSRLNSVLKTDIAVAAAEANNEEIPDEDSRGGLLHRSHSASSGKQQRHASKRSSHKTKGGTSVLPVEEGSFEDEFSPAATHSTWKTRTDRNLRDLGTVAPARTAPTKSSKRVTSSPLGSPAPPPLEPGSYTAQEGYGSPSTPHQTRRALDAEASSLASTEPQTPLAGTSWAQSPTIAAGTTSVQGTPVTRRKVTADSPRQHAPFAPNLAAASQGSYPAAPPGGELEPPLDVAVRSPSGYPSAKWAYGAEDLSVPAGSAPQYVDKRASPVEKPGELQGPVQVRKVVRKKGSKKPSRRTAHPTGTGKGHTYEAVRYASSQGSTPSHGGGLYQVTAPSSALDGFPSVPKAPRGGDYRPPRSSRRGVSRISTASSEEGLPEYLRTQAQRGYTGSKPVSLARGVLA